MSNIHADLIKNATNMQSQLLQFSHELSNLSLKSLEDQSNFKMTVAPIFESSTVGTPSPSAASSTIPANTYISVEISETTTYHKLTSEVSISGENGNYPLTDALDPAIEDIGSIIHSKIKINAFPVTQVTFQLNGTEIVVKIPRSGVPGEPTEDVSASQKTVAKAMAVVAMNLRGVGVEEADILEIFKNGITPTSLAAVESQLKGHHDAVLQLSLESLSRVTNILQKIAQKLGS
jgi:hypothetical protein